MNLLNLKKSFVAYLFPEFCLGCGKEGTLCCADCLAKIELNQMPLSLKKDLRYLDKIFCAVSYQNYLVKKLIQNFKYSPYCKNLAQPLTYLILSHFLLNENKLIFQTGENSLIAPVPLFKTKQKRRGFNQSALIAQELARALNVKIMVDNLVKIKKTSSQMELDRLKREKNVVGSFALKNFSLVLDKKILLIDDVLTTGATLNECARVLKAAGARQVIAITVAHQPLIK